MYSAEGYVPFFPSVLSPTEALRLAVIALIVDGTVPCTCPRNCTHREPCNVMHSLQGMYWKNITYAFKMCFHSNSADIALAVEGHQLELHNEQFGKNNLKKISIKGSFEILRH